MFGLPSPRVVVRWLKTQERIAAALERIADAYAGPVIVVPAVKAEPPQVADDPRWEFGHAYEEEVKLTALLGREPTADELVHHLEAQEFTGEEETTVPAVLRARAAGGQVR